MKQLPTLPQIIPNTRISPRPRSLCVADSPRRGEYRALDSGHKTKIVRPPADQQQKIGFRISPMNSKHIRGSLNKRHTTAFTSVKSLSQFNLRFIICGIGLLMFTSCKNDIKPCMPLADATIRSLKYFEAHSVFYGRRERDIPVLIHRNLKGAHGKVLMNCDNEADCMDRCGTEDSLCRKIIAHYLVLSRAKIATAWAGNRQRSFTFTEPCSEYKVFADSNYNAIEIEYRNNE